MIPAAGAGGILGRGPIRDVTAGTVAITAIGRVFRRSGLRRSEQAGDQR